jgi:hypothetical protein
MTYSARAVEEHRFGHGTRRTQVGRHSCRRCGGLLAPHWCGRERYSRGLQEDTSGVIRATIAAHNGRLVKTTGDGFLVEFSSVVDALRCATEFQARMAERNAAASTDRCIEFRLGINVSDVVVEGGELFGDGVNVAVRLEGLADPGGICVSARVQEDATGKLDVVFEDIGEQELKNIVRPVRVFRVRPGLGPGGGDPPTLPRTNPTSPRLRYCRSPI